MKAKTLKFLGLIALSIPLMSCAVPGHTHRNDGTWKGDETNHWHECLDCHEKYDQHAHEWNNGEITTPATCEDAGVKTFTCDTCSRTKTEEISALGHEMGQPAYVWTDDNSICTATVSCERPGCDHHEDESVVASHEVITPATCDSEGSEKLTATFTDSRFTTQEKTVAIPELGHLWGNPTYSWEEAAAGGYVCSARVECEREGCDALEAETGTMSYEVVTDPTCEDYGQGKWTAKFDNQKFAEQTKNVQIDPTGHSYTYSYVWDLEAEPATCEGTATCTNPGCESVLHENASEVTHEVTQQATCEEAGNEKWTAKFPTFPETIKNVTIPAKGHDESGEWVHDDDGHWKVCPDCGNKILEAAHTFENGVCTECGKQKDYTPINELIDNEYIWQGDTCETVGYVSAIYKNNSYQGIYIGDGPWGIQVFGYNNNNLNIGDIVEVKGTYTLDASKRFREITSPTVTKLSAVPEFFDLDPIEDFAIDSYWPNATKDIEANNNPLNRAVTFDGVMTSRPATIAKGSDNTIVGIDRSGQEVKIFIKKNNCADDVYTEFNKINVGDKFSVSGIVGTYNGNTQIVCPTVPTLIDTPSAKIGDKFYYSVDEAVADIPTDNTPTTVNILKDIPEANGIVTVAGQNVVFDFNGHTFTIKNGVGSNAVKKTIGFQLNKDSIVTLKNGTIDCYDWGENPSGNPDYNDNINRIRMIIQNYADLSLEDIVIDHANGLQAVCAVSTNYGVVRFDKDTVVRANTTVEGAYALDEYFYGTPEVYRDGVSVVFDPEYPLDNMSGAVMYGFDAVAGSELESKWFNRATVTAGDSGPRTLAFADEIANGDERKYESLFEFLNNLVEIQVKLESIAITTPATKTTFKVGEAFSAAGMVVTGYYDDETSKAISDYTTSINDGYVFTTEDIATGITVTVASGEKTDAYTINVIDNAISTTEAKALAANETAIIQGDVVCLTSKGFLVADAAGVMTVYQNAAPSVNLGDYVRVTGTVKDKIGTKQIETPTVAVGIGEDPEIEHIPVQLTNEEWDSHSASDVKLIKGIAKVYQDGSNYNFYYCGNESDLTQQATNAGYVYLGASGVNFCTSANVGKYIEFQGYLGGLSSAGNRAIFNCDWREYVPATTSIDLSVDASVLNMGETANLTAVCHPDGASQDVTYEVTEGEGIVSISEEGVVTAISAGTATIVAKQDSITSNSVSVTVQNVTLTSVVITGDMTNKSYQVGDDWDYSGLTVTAYYSDSSSADVTLSASYAATPTKADATTTTSLTVVATYNDVASEAFEVTGIEIEDKPAVTTYSKVTAAQTDWSGTYLVVAENINSTNCAFTGVDAVNGYVETTIVDSHIDVGNNDVCLIIEKMDDGYSLKLSGGTNDGKYISYAVNNNGLSFGTSPVKYSISYSNDSVLITNAGGAVLRFNSTSNQMRFRFYKASSYSAQQPIQLYKLDA